MVIRVIVIVKPNMLTEYTSIDFYKNKSTLVYFRRAYLRLEYSFQAWTEDEHGLCNLARNCHKSNMVIKPEKGKAVLWYNHLIRRHSGWLGQVDFRSFHGGCNVQKGEKWIANNWINVSPIRMDDFRLWASEKIIKEQKKRPGGENVNNENLYPTASAEKENIEDVDDGEDDINQSHRTDTRNEL